MVSDLHKYTQSEAINLATGVGGTWTPLEMKYTEDNGDDGSSTGNLKGNLTSKTNTITVDVSDYKAILFSNAYYTVDDDEDIQKNISATTRIRFDTNPWVTHGGTTLDHYSDHDVVLRQGQIPAYLEVPNLGSSVYFHFATSWGNKTTIYSVCGII